MRHFISIALLAALAAEPTYAEESERTQLQCSVEIPAGVQEVLKRECDEKACYERQVRELKMMVMTFAVTSETYKKIIDAITSRPIEEAGPPTDL